MYRNLNENFKTIYIFLLFESKLNKNQLDIANVQTQLVVLGQTVNKIEIKITVKYKTKQQQYV